MEPTILDSGSRREFETGAVRDIVEGKGRCDLLPLDSVSNMLYLQGYKTCGSILANIYDFIVTGNRKRLSAAMVEFSKECFGDSYTAILEVAKHYEQGCNKYGERNWEKGIPLHCYIDSGVRHLLKFYRGDRDEPHDRAFLWNMLGADWTMVHHSDLIDLPFRRNSANSNVSESEVVVSK